MLPRLRARGHAVRAIDLPGHGEDRTPALRVGLGSYARRILDATAGFDGPPILVGHSMGGMAITQAAADAPARFAALVYLCAFAPRAGDRVVGLARGDRASLIPESTSLGLGTLRFREGQARPAFYGRCSEQDAAWAEARLRPDPLRPLLQGLAQPRAHGLPCGAIFCSEDRAISLERQRVMAERVGVRRTATIETDHSPFLSTPDALAGHLDALAPLAAG